MYSIDSRPFPNQLNSHCCTQLSISLPYLTLFQRVNLINTVLIGSSNLVIPAELHLVPWNWTNTKKTESVFQSLSKVNFHLFVFLVIIVLSPHYRRRSKCSCDDMIESPRSRARALFTRSKNPVHPKTRQRWRGCFHYQFSETDHAPKAPGTGGLLLLHHTKIRSCGQQLTPIW